MDIHALAILPDTSDQNVQNGAGSDEAASQSNASTSGENGSLLIAATNNDLNISRDEGATWQPQNVSGTFPNRYCRGLLTLPDNPDAVLVGNGNGPPGTVGALMLSRDRAGSWQNVDLPAPVNSTVWTFALSPANPRLVFAATVLGQLFRSDDGGQSWRKCRHEFGELRALAVTSL